MTRTSFKSEKSQREDMQGECIRDTPHQAFLDISPTLLAVGCVGHGRRRRISADGVGLQETKRVSD